MKTARELAHEIVVSAFRRAEANLYCSAAIKGHGECSHTCDAVTAAIKDARREAAEDMRERAAQECDHGYREDDAGWLKRQTIGEIIDRIAALPLVPK